MSNTLKKARASAIILLAVPVCLLLSPSAWASEIACVSGHLTLVTPCTFDGSILSLDSAPGLDIGGGGGGHHTLVEFSGSTITIMADILHGNPPYSAADNTTTCMTGLMGPLTVSTVSGSPLIDDLSLQLLFPSLIGTGTMSFSGTGTANLVALTGLPGSTFENVTFAPTNSLTETFNFQLSTGCGAPSVTCTGNAIIDGLTIGVSLVPEPSSLTLTVVALFAAGFRFRRRFL